MMGTIEDQLHMPRHTIRATDEQVDWVVKQFREKQFGRRGEFDGNSDQRFFGVLGELVVRDRLRLPRQDISRPDPGYDFLLDDVTWDVKTQVAWGQPLKIEFLCVPALQMRYSVDYLLFLFHAPIDPVAKPFHVLGYMSKKEFQKRATYHQQGTTAPQPGAGRAEFRFKTDSWRLPFGSLHELASINDLPRVGKEGR